MPCRAATQCKWCRRQKGTCKWRRAMGAECGTCPVVVKQNLKWIDEHGGQQDMLKELNPAEGADDSIHDEWMRKIDEQERTRGSGKYTKTDVTVQASLF